MGTLGLGLANPNPNPNPNPDPDPDPNPYIGARPQWRRARALPGAATAALGQPDAGPLPRAKLHPTNICTCTGTQAATLCAQAATLCAPGCNPNPNQVIYCEPIFFSTHYSRELRARLLAQAP
eukprot:scaffold101480_cov35-Phaeocystis_antarctica.AAC.1